MWLIETLNANPTLKNLLIAVLTALATTLAVEYLAKPKLEARKARIIRDRNQIDEVIFQLQEIGQLLGSLRIADLKYIEDLSDFLKGQAEQAEKSLDRLQQAIARLPLKYVVRHSRHIRVSAFHQGLIRAHLKKLKEYIDEESYGEAFNATIALEELADHLHSIDVTFELSRRSWLHKLVNKSDVRQQAELAASAMEALGLSMERPPLSINSEISAPTAGAGVGKHPEGDDGIRSGQ